MTAISALLLISVLLVVLRVNCRTDYEELYRSNEYLSGLPSLITRCSMDPEYERENKLECSVADYISRISKAHNTLLTTPATVLTPSITIVKKPLSYEKLFSDYISENQPVTSQVEVQMAHTALEIVQKCGDGFTGSLAKCKEYQVTIMKGQHCFLIIFCGDCFLSCEDGSGLWSINCLLYTCVLQCAHNESLECFSLLLCIACCSSLIALFSHIFDSKIFLMVATSTSE